MTGPTVNANHASWFVSPEPHPDHVAWAERGGRLFATAAWARVLHALGAHTLFAWHEQQEVGAVVPVFRRFGLRVGFLGFPVAGADLDDIDSGELGRCAAAIAAPARLDILRTTQSLRTRSDARAISGRPEVWIESLQQWQLGDHKRLRKDIAFAQRMAPTTRIVRRDFDVSACFGLYASTIARHGAQLRYGPAYFEALHGLSLESSLLCFCAAVDGDAVKGFAVAALNAGVAHYLHGAVDAASRRHGISDLLLEQLLAYSRTAGASRFTFMASPWEQPGLQQFKQKWADSTGLSVTYDYAGTLLGRGAVLVSRWQRRHDWEKAAAFVAHREAVEE